MNTVPQSTSIQLNTTFSDARPLESEIGKVRGITNAPASMTNVSNTESEYTLSSFFTKEICIDNFNWSSGSARDLVLKSYEMPTVLFRKAVTPQYNLLRSLAYYRTDLRIRVQVNGTQFHAGMLATSFVPISGPTFTSTFRSYTVSGYPNSKNRANSNNNTTLHIPYQHFRDYLNSYSTQTLNSLGTLYVSVFNQLRPSTTASDSIPVSIWLSAVQPELHNIVPDHELPNFTPTSGLEAIEATASSLARGDIANSFRGAADVISNFTGQRDYPVAASFDKNFPVSVPSIAQSAGIRTAQCLDLNPLTEYLPDISHVATASDEMDLANIIQVSMQLDRFEWNINKPAGSILFACPVRPNYIGSTVITTSAILHPHYLGYTSVAFARWRGQLEYHIQVVKNNFANGRLAAIFFPYDVPADTILSVEQLTIPSAAIIDIEEFQDYPFITPWNSNTRWKYINDNDAADNRYDSAAIPKNRSLELIAGTFVLAVVNPLNQAVQSGDFCEINIYVKAHNGFEFDIPRPTKFGEAARIPNDLPVVPVAVRRPIVLNQPQDDLPVRKPNESSSDDEYDIYPTYNPLSIDQPVLTSYIQNTFTIGDEIEFDASRTSMANTSSDVLLQTGSVTMPTDPAIISPGNPNMHLKVLLARHYPHFVVDSQTSDTATTFTITHPVCPKVPTVGGANVYTFSDLIQYFSNLFVFWTGSINYMYINNYTRTFPGLSIVSHRPDKFNSQVTVSNTNGDSSDYFDLAYASSALTPASQNTMAINVPWKSIFTNLSATGLLASNYNSNGELLYQCTIVGSGNEIRTLCLRSLGEDFRFSYLIPPQDFTITI